MHVSSRMTLAAALATSAALLAGCGSSGGSGGSSSAGGASPSSSSAPSSSSSSSSATSSARSSAPAAASSSYKKGSTVSQAQLQADVTKAVQKAGGTYRTTLTSSSVSSVADHKQKGQVTDIRADETLAGRKVKLIIVGGVAYVGGSIPGAGAGGKPWTRITQNSTSPFAKGLRPALLAASGQGTPPTVQWTVVSSSASGTVLTSVPVAGAKSTLTLDARGLPKTAAVQTPSGKQNEVYSNYGKPVTITAPPASQVQPDSAVKSTTSTT